MNNRMVICILLIVAFLAPRTSHARYLNVNTGRFHTMDSAEGNTSDPPSLHKYLYAAGNPGNRIDPSGNFDIGEALGVSATIDILAQSGFSVTPSSAISTGSSPGPDITTALFATMNNVEQTFLPLPIGTKAAIALKTHSPAIGDGWDIPMLKELGFPGATKIDFGNGSSLGTGLGTATVQFGVPPKVYWAGSVNYILWGRMFYLLNYTFQNPLTGFPDPSFTETAAVAEARTFKAVFWNDWAGTTAKQAGAFTRLGYSATDPSSTALSLKPNPKNVAASTRFKWKWIGLHDTAQ